MISITKGTLFHTDSKCILITGTPSIKLYTRDGSGLDWCLEDIDYINKHVIKMYGYTIEPHLVIPNCSLLLPIYPNDPPISIYDINFIIGVDELEELNIGDLVQGITDMNHYGS